MEWKCGKELKIIVAYKSDTFELCEGDEKPSEKQRADPISSEVHEIVFPKGQIAVGESFDVCEISGGLSDCKTLTNSLSKQTEGGRPVAIESREIGLTDICKSNLSQRTSFKAMWYYSWGKYAIR